MTYSCPACGGDISFKSSISVSTVCPYCQSLLLKNDQGLEELGKMAKLPEDLTPFQVGTRGQYGGAKFEILGRMRIGWSDGMWNEWFASFSDGREGWLAEAQGALMMSFRDTSEASPPSLSKLFPGAAWNHDKKLYKVDDIKKAKCIGSEGELPVAAAQGRESTSVDLSTMNGDFATIEFAGNQTRVFTGRYVEFDQLGLTNLRELDGW